MICSSQTMIFKISLLGLLCRRSFAFHSSTCLSIQSARPSLDRLRNPQSITIIKRCRTNTGQLGSAAEKATSNITDKVNTQEGKDNKRKTITFVTGNKNKLAEVQQMLSSSSIPFDIDNVKLDLPELQGSPEDIAREKCETASKELQTAVFTEDTCLCFCAMNNLPGPYIKWFLEGLGHDGLNKMLHGFDDDSAYAQTIIAFSSGPGKEVQLFEGRTQGRIVPARGSKDFGWDPIFEPTSEEQQRSNHDERKTYAEMTKDEKNAISHRGRAFDKFRDYLSSQSNIILNDMS